MMEEVGSFPHNLSNSSPVVVPEPDLRQHVERPGRKPRQHPVAEGAVDHRARQDAPASWCGKTTRSRTASCTASGRRRRSATSAASCRSCTRRATAGCAATKRSRGKKLWEFDTNPKDSVWPKTRNEVISTPVIFENVVYISNGQDPEHGEGVGHAYAIDATKRGDITESGRLWHYDKIRRSISTAAIKDGLIYLADFSGFLHCLDLKTGKPYWTHDMFAAIWGSPMIIDDKVYLGDEDGDITVLQHGKELKVVAEQNMGSSVYSTVVPANGALFVMNRNQLYALAEGAHAEAAERSQIAGLRRRRCETQASLHARIVELRMDRRAFLQLAAAHCRCRALAWRRRRARRPPMRGRISAARQRSPASPRRRSRPRSSASGSGKPAPTSRSIPRRPSSAASSTSAPPPASWSRWRWPTARCAGATRPASRSASRRRPVAGGRVFIGDLEGAVHAVNAADGKARLDLQDASPRSSRRRSSPAISC